MSAAVEVAAQFELMRRDAPAAAYLLARTLHNARSFINDDRLSRAQQLAHLDGEIQTLTARPNIDGGATLLALRFLRTVVGRLRRPDFGYIGLSAAFGDIAKHGEHYRGLEERDRRPPRSLSACEALAKSGRRCVAELIDTVRSEGQQIGEDPSETIYSLIAMYDIHDEADAGFLVRHLRRLEPLFSGLSKKDEA